MNRAEFMTELRDLLSDISEAEREEALNYYEDYFDDAGVENESSVIASLGTPGKVAAMIKHGIYDGNEDGEFTENGFSDNIFDKKEEVLARNLSSEERGFHNGWRMNNGAWIVLLIVCVFALPILIPVLGGIASAVLGILCAAVSVLFAVLVAGISMVLGGGACIVSGFMTAIMTPSVGIMLMGIGLVAIGVGILLAVLGVWILAKVVPVLVRGIANLGQKIFKRKQV